MEAFHQNDDTLEKEYGLGRSSEIKPNETPRLRWPIASHPFDTRRRLTLCPLRGTKDTPLSPKPKPITSELLSTSVLARTIKAQQDALQHQQLKHFRDTAIANPRCRFTKTESDRFCSRLLGADEMALCHAVALRGLEERSHADAALLESFCRRAKAFFASTTPEQRLLYLRFAVVIFLIQGSTLPARSKRSRLRIRAPISAGDGTASNCAADVPRQELPALASPAKLYILARGLLSFRVRDDEICVLKVSAPHVAGMTPLTELRAATN